MALLENIRSYASSLYLGQNSVVLDKQVTLAEMVQSPTFSPGPMLVLLVTSVLFVL